MNSSQELKLQKEEEDDEFCDGCLGYEANDKIGFDLIREPARCDRTEIFASRGTVRVMSLLEISL